jgi:hypothetical protein
MHGTTLSATSGTVSRNIWVFAVGQRPVFVKTDISTCHTEPHQMQQIGTVYGKHLGLCRGSREPVFVKTPLTHAELHTSATSGTVCIWVFAIGDEASLSARIEIPQSRQRRIAQRLQSTHCRTSGWQEYANRHQKNLKQMIMVKEACSRCYLEVVHTKSRTAVATTGQPSCAPVECCRTS